MLRRATLARGIAGSGRPVAGPATPSAPNESLRGPPSAQQLLVDALDAPASMRSDLDLAVLQHFLASLDAFASVAPGVLHCADLMDTRICVAVWETYGILLDVGTDLSTECSMTRVADGDVLCYQEDPIDDSSCAFVVVGLFHFVEVEGSLCGYYNKAFAQRDNTEESFSVWNQKQGKGRELVIEFGELQTTYRNNDLCCFEEFFNASKTPSAPRIHRFCHRKGIHAQEHTLLLTFAKDTLERAVQRFGLSYHQCSLSSKKLAGKSEYTYIAALNLLSARSRAELLQSASRERLENGAMLFSSRENESPHSEIGFLIVAQGRLEICLFSNTNSVSFAEIDADRDTEKRILPPAKDKLTSSDQVQVVASIGKGRSFGDQTIALGKCNFWSNSSVSQMLSTRTDWKVRVIVAEPGTEIVWIPKALYEHHLREDRLRFAYVPFSLLEIQGSTEREWNNFISSSKSTIETTIRDGEETSRISRQIMADICISRLFAQLPPIVIERFCECLRIQSFIHDTKILSVGDSISFVMIVVQGSLAMEPSRDQDTQAELRKARLSTDEWYRCGQLIPGDVFGAKELQHNSTASLHSVNAIAGTIVLCIPQLVFHRWLCQTESQVEFLTGSMLQQLTAVSSPSKMARSEIRKLSTTIGTHQSIVSQSSTSSSTHPIVSHLDSNMAAQSSETVSLFQRLGVLDHLPPFLRAQLLPFVTLVRKQAGEVVFQEMEEKQVLVVLMSGFISIYSREHLAAAAEMLHNHAFCRYTSFFASHTNPDEYADAMSLDSEQDETNDIAHFHIGHSPSKHHHRLAFHGLHIHTLPPLGAFRTGVLHDGRVCPGSVVAQTDCEYIVVDENIYNHVLAHHRPLVRFNSVNTADLTSDQGNQAAVSEDVASETTSTTVMKNLDESSVPWKFLSPAKRQLVVRSLRHVVLHPGHQLVVAGDRITDLVIVVSGRLSLFVRHNQQAASMIDAREQTMKSLKLERSVTSNYATTSQQLYNDEDDEPSATVPNSRQRLTRRGDSIAFRRQLSKITREPAAHASGIFVDSVMAAIEEEKFKRQSSKLRTNDSANQQGKRGVIVAPLLHSAIHRASIDRKLSLQRASRRISTQSTHYGKNHHEIFVCFLNSGDVYGEEVLSKSTSCQTSKHDIYAEAVACTTVNPGQDSAALGRIELLCLDRRVFMSILTKSDEDAENELRMRSVIVRSKWRRAGKDAALAKRLQPGLSAGAEKENSSRPAQTATPKLLTLFQNLVNQRFHLTTRAIAEIPLLRSLPEPAKREICLVAKFETLDRRSDLPSFNRHDANNAADGKKSEASFFIVLSGRVALVAKSYQPHSIVHNSAYNSLGGAIESGHILREVEVGEGFGEFNIFVPNAPKSLSPVAVESAKMLSIPAAMFIKYWPFAHQMKENIEYLRNHVPLFADLPVERLAQLYHIVEFRNFTRANTIFDLANESSRTSVLDTMCLVKAGTCCIRQELVIEPPANSDATDLEQDRISPQLGQRVKAKASIADVSAGHLFWLQANTPIISLEAVSASVSVALFQIDRLKSILPRSYLLKLDAFRNGMEILHQQQVRLAQQALATFIKEKALASLVKKQVPCFSSSADPSLPPTRSLPAVIPRNRSLASARPAGKADNTIDPKLSPKETGMQIVTSQVECAHSIHECARVAKETLPHFYNSNQQHPSHAQEHYYPGVDVLDLAGSFVDDSSTNVLVSSKYQNDDTRASKQDEYSNAEKVHPLRPLTPRRSTSTSESRTPQQWSVSVSIPRIPNDTPTLTVSGLPATCRPRTPGVAPPKPMSSSRPESPSWRFASDSLIYDGATSVLLTSLEMQRVDDNDREWLSFEIDLRSRIAAQLADFSSPMRMIPLKPCRPIERTGTDWSPRPKDSEHDNRNEEENAISELLPTAAAYPIMKGGVKSGNYFKNSPRRSDLRPRQPEIIRKQGFLEVAGTFSTGQWTLTTGCRRFFVLVGRQLREYADTIALHNLSIEIWNCCYNFGADSKVLDVTNKAIPMLESVRAQSFTLVTDSSASFVLTAPSQIERKQWMVALSDACSYQQGETLEASYPSARKLQAPAVSPRHRKRTTGQAKTGGDDDLPVEYCIS